MIIILRASLVRAAWTIQNPGTRAASNASMGCPLAAIGCHWLPLAVFARASLSWPTYFVPDAKKNRREPANAILTQWRRVLPRRPPRKPFPSGAWPQPIDSTTTPLSPANFLVNHECIFLLHVNVFFNIPFSKPSFLIEFIHTFIPSNPTTFFLRYRFLFLFLFPSPTVQTIAQSPVDSTNFPLFKSS
jgi:hypothetical protein